MKKLFKNPVLYIGAIFISVIAGSQISCTSHASNNEEKTTTEEVSMVAMPGEVVPLNENTFDQSIKSGIVLVDFFATWCRPCKMQSPILEEISMEMAGKSTVFKVDIDKNPSIASRYNVVSIPTLILFKDGKAVGQFVGFTQKNDIISEIEKIAKTK